MMVGRRLSRRNPGFGCPMDRLPPDDRSRRPRASAGQGRTAFRSRRFLGPQEIAASDPRRLRGSEEIFAEGHWHAIRVVLERQGWGTRQIELVHDHLRQGWPLDMAKEQVGILTGHCPLRSHRAG